MGVRTIKRNLFALVLCAYWLLSQSATAFTIDTTGGESGALGTFGDRFGSGTYAPSIGQTFSVPNSTDTVFDSFTFWVNDQPGPMVFKGYVSEWRDISASGDGMLVSDLLFESDVRNTTDVPGNALLGMEEFTFSTGGLRLSPDKTYVAFISVLGLETGVDTASVVRFVGGDRYLGGNEVGLFSGWSDGRPAFDDMYTKRWIAGTTRLDWDLYTVLDFSAAPLSVPEPTTLNLFAIGLASIAWFRRRKIG